jgi:hypothetical protein
MEDGGSVRPLSQLAILRTSRLDAAGDAVRWVCLPHHPTKGRTFADRIGGRRAMAAARSSARLLLPDPLNTVGWTADAGGT